MKNIKKIIKKYFNSFSYFFSHLRYRVFVAFALSLIVGILDGFGLAMFLPLLQMVNGEEEVNSEDLGGLKFLVEVIQDLGFGLTLTSVLTTILVFFILKGIAKFFESYYKVLIQRYFIEKLRVSSIDKLVKFDYKAFVTADSGRIQNTLTGEVSRVAQAYQSYFGAAQSAVLVVVYITLALLSNPQFAILVALGGGASNIIYRRIYKKTKAASKNITSIGHQYQGLLIQKVAFFKYLKATGLNEVYAEKLKKTVYNIEKHHKKIGLNNSILTATREPLVISVVIIIILIQVNLFSESLGLIILSLLFFYRSLTFVMNFQNQWNQFLNVSGSLSNMTSFIDGLTMNQEKSGRNSINVLAEKIELRNVSFYYGEKAVLKNINLDIHKNQTIAFVGESGSGKTSLVNLIAGLITVEDDNGEMLIDGVSLRNINITSYRKRIGYIAQEPVIFSDTVYNNVTFWADKTPENVQRFWMAIHKAAIDDFIKELPEREDSFLGNAGVLVSGGQKQRISIARELYKEVDILIMDEATSALDSETELAVQDNINALKGSYTILIVAHRLSTIKEADAIVLMNKGEIVNVGRFETLIENSNKFRYMVEIQEL